MATSRPISTISYNSKEFLKEHLDDWVKAHLIQAYMFICHKGEDGDKDHIHLRIEPNKTLDPMALSDQLVQFVQGEELPRRVRTWRPSKEEDWVLYAVHDAEYLASKSADASTREKLPYEWQDIVASEGFDVEVAYIRAKSTLAHSAPNMAKRIMEGEKPLKLVQEGHNIFEVQGIMNLVRTNDYTRVLDEYHDLAKRYKSLSDRFEHLLDAVETAGFYVAVDPDTGLPVLCRDSDDSLPSSADSARDHYLDGILVPF